jgi:hypothetical protein
MRIETLWPVVGFVERGWVAKVLEFAAIEIMTTSKLKKGRE